MPGDDLKVQALVMWLGSKLNVDRSLEAANLLFISEME